MGKLVRDLIPQIVRDSGMIPITRIISEEEYLEKLFDKLAEETEELKKSENIDQRIEELADVLEVLDAIRMYFEIHLRLVEEKKLKKCVERGGFNLRIILDDIKPKSD